MQISEAIVHECRGERREICAGLPAPGRRRGLADLPPGVNSVAPGAAAGGTIGVIMSALPRPAHDVVTPAASASLSGLNAAQTRLDVAGHNVANSLTEGFRRQVAQPATAQPAGVTVSIAQMPEAGHDLAADTVGMIEARHAFGANLMVFRAQDAMSSSLLDIRA